MNLRRKTIPNSKDIRIVGSSGEDIGRVAKDGKIVYPGKEGLRIVQAVNACERMLKETDALHKELALYQATAKDLKPVDLSAISRRSDVDLSAISRRSDILFTHIRFEEYELSNLLMLEKDGVKRGRNWLEFGSCEICNEGRTCFIGSRMRDGITDFEHSTPYVVRIDLLGLQYKLTTNHVSYFEAHVTPDIDGIRIHTPDFVPEKVKGAVRCDRCEKDGHGKHLMLPDGNYVPPIYEFARLVAGTRISICMGMGPRRDKIENGEGD